jgi:hypothetical protein
MDLPIVAGVEFRAVVGFPGYAVGDDGSVWSCRKSGNGSGRFGRWRKLRPVPMQNGYLQVFLRRDGKTVKFLVHHLVLLTFVGPPGDRQECRHFPDKDVTNNRKSNLQWGTDKENCQDKFIHNTQPLGVRHYNSKLSEGAVREMRRTKNENTISSFARRFGVAEATVQDAIAGRTWKHVH